MFTHIFLFLVSIQLTLAIRCYECNNCTDIPSCTCEDIVDVNGSYYCILSRETLSTGVQIEIKHFPRDIPTFYVYDPYYISVKETISFDNKTERWSSVSDRIVYGCQTDECNTVDLLKKLPPNGLSLMLPSDWLNANLQRKTPGDLALCRTCDPDIEEVCDNSSESFNITHICPRNECIGSCMIDETSKKSETTQFCYASTCTDSTFIGPTGKLSEVSITAVYYINKEQFEVTDIYLICNANDCSSLNIFKDIKENLQINLNNIKPFLPNHGNSTFSTSQVSSTFSTSQVNSTFSPNHVNSIYSTSIIFLMIILFFQIIVFY